MTKVTNVTARPLQAPPDPLAGFKGPTSKGREWREKEGKGEGRGKEEREGDMPPF